MNKIHEATQEYLKKDIPDFDTGDTLVVSVLVREGNKERVQNFEGVVIGRKAGDSLDATFTVRRRGRVRRAKLNYLRDISGSKGTRIKEKR